MTIHGGVNNIQDDQVASLALIVDELIPRGMILANEIYNSLPQDGSVIGTIGRGLPTEPSTSEFHRRQRRRPTAKAIVAPSATLEINAG